MTAEELPSRPIRFSLRSMLIVILVCAVLLAFFPQIRWILGGKTTHYRISAILIPGVIAVAAFLLGCRLAQASRRSLRSKSAKLLLCPLFVVACFACSYAIWGRRRVLTLLAWEESRPLPYPDTAILAFHDWLDARNPPPPGFFKIHGEFYTVWLIADSVVLVLIAATAVLAGLLVPEVPTKIAASRASQWLWKQSKEDVFAGIAQRFGRGRE
jgi:hypothetical protein